MRRLCKFILVTVIGLFCLLELNAGPPQATDIYKIQVASHANQVSNERVQSDLGLNQPVTMHYIGGRYKYFVGRYNSWAAANSHIGEVPVQGAYVVKVPFTSQTESEDPVVQDPVREETVPKTVPTETGVVEEMTYRIQLAASRTYIRPEYFREKFDLQQNVDYFREEGYYKYVIGDYQSLDAAEEAINLMRLSGKAFAVLAPIERTVIKPVELSKVAQPEEDKTIEPQTAAGEQEGIQADSDFDQKAVRDQYSRKIEEADSAFFVKEYLLARRHYSDARVLAPEKTYPRDRINEIDVLLKQERSQPLLDSIGALTIGIIIFIVILIAVVIFVLILRNRRKRVDVETEKVRDEYMDSVSEYLFDESGAEPANLRTANTQKKRQILIDEIMQLYANLSGEISNKLRELYLDLDLDNDSVKKTKSPQWHIRAKGFRELAQMNIKTVNDEIERCLNSDNDVLRMEAQLAMVRLNYESPFSFLDRLEKPFTAWEQLHVYEMIQRHQIPAPDFTRWLNSPNETVVLFCVRMIHAFKQVEATKRVVDLLGHKNKDIKNEAIITLGELNVLDVLPELKARYTKEDQTGKVLILQAMSKMPEESNVDFLTGILEPSNELRIEAADALARIESFGVRGIENILRRSDDDLQAVARHILDNKL
ncbi:MAG: hypothetical protein HN936_12255 [Bacteroidetes bacterium]|nr:hypothetical protein [Bacteroidota bacterium]